MASTVHLKIKYHNDLGKSVVIVADLCGARHIHETIVNNPLAIVVASERRRKKERETINVVGLDVPEEEI